MANDRLAVLADIHGNLWALEAVLYDMDKRGISAALNLGDCLYGPLDPAGTAELLIPLGWPTVRGNEDRIIVDHGIAASPDSTLSFVRAELAAVHRAYLTGLPLYRVEHGSILMFHGTPERDDEYLLQQVTENGVRPRPSASAAALLSAFDVEVVICGHDHTPGSLWLESGTLVVNPGSVGLQAYTDDVPHCHAIANGSPEARYAVLKRTAEGWVLEPIEVAYDFRAAAAAARRNGRPDWAMWLETGKALTS